MNKKINKILELYEGKKDVNINAKIIDISEVREIKDRYDSKKKSAVATVVLNDGSGECEVGVWNEQINSVKMNDNVLIRNAYCKGSYENRLKLTLGKYGSLVVVND